MAALAKKMGYRQASSIQRYMSESDFRGQWLPPKFALKLADAIVGLGTPPITEREVLALAGPLAKFAKDRSIPLISFVQAGNWTQIVEFTGDGETLIADRFVGPRCFALEIKGHSMLPRFQEGDRIIIDPDEEPIPGDMVVAKLDNEDEATFKQYRPRGFDSKKRQIIELRPLNEDWPTIPLDAQNPGRVIGVMVEHRNYRRRNGR